MFCQFHIKWLDSLKSDLVMKARKIYMLGYLFFFLKNLEMFSQVSRTVFVATFKVLKIFRILKSFPQNYRMY